MNDLISAAGQFGVGFIATYAYDMMSSLPSNKCLTDGLVAGTSFAVVDVLVTNLFKNMSIPGVSDIKTQHYLNTFVIKPVLSALLYSYLYESYYLPQYAGNNADSHSKNKLFHQPVIINFKTIV